MDFLNPDYGYQLYGETTQPEQYPIQQSSDQQSSQAVENQVLRLTGKAIPEIADHLDIDKEDTELNVYLTGFLFCKLFETGEQGVISEDYIDYNLQPVSNDQFACISTYLARYRIGSERIQDLTELAYYNGYLTYDPEPFLGKINIYGTNGEILSRGQKDLIDNIRVKYDYLTADTYYQEHVFSFVEDYIFFQNEGLSWNQLLYILCQARIDQESVLKEGQFVIYQQFEEVLSDNLEPVLMDKTQYYIVDGLMNPIGSYGFS